MTMADAMNESSPVYGALVKHVLLMLKMFS
jgi:hypothetical protein